MIYVILAFFGSLFPATLYNVDKKRFLWVGLSGVTGWIAYDYFNKGTGNVILATFIGSLVVGLYSEIMARKIKAPAIIFSVSGIFPLVPGLGAYETAKFFMDKDVMGGITKGIETFASAGSIAIGIMLMSGAFKASKKFREKRSIK
jgi:uncharacterized membrane protein YjjB (DUF3815 family)